MPFFSRSLNYPTAYNAGPILLEETVVTSRSQYTCFPLFDIQKKNNKKIQHGESYNEKTLLLIYQLKDKS